MPIYASIVSPGYMPAVVETTADICGRNGSVVVATMGSSYLPSRCPDECGLLCGNCYGNFRACLLLNLYELIAMLLIDFSSIIAFICGSFVSNSSCNDAASQ